jgi:excisionase family DNA binding protein
MDSDSKTLSVDDAARLLGISRSLAYEGVRMGQIPSIRIGKRIIVPRAALDRMLDTGTVVVDT